MTLTYDRLRQVLHYNRTTGVWTWIAASRADWNGREAGTVNKQGYRQISIDGTVYLAHRLAWLYVNARWPEHQVDHKDRDRANNRWKNLRAATRAQNAANVSPHRDGTSPLKGVCWHKAAQKWCAQIFVRGERRYLGLFDTEQEAAEVYARAAADAFGEFAG